MTDDERNHAIEAYSKIAEQVEKEDGLVNQRLTWGASINGALFALLAVLFKDFLLHDDISGHFWLCDRGIPFQLLQCWFAARPLEALWMRGSRSPISETSTNDGGSLGLRTNCTCLDHFLIRTRQADQAFSTDYCVQLALIQKRLVKTHGGATIFFGF